MKRRFFLCGLLVAACASLWGCATPAASYTGTVTWGAPLAHATGQYPKIVIQNDASAAWPVRQAVASWGIPVSYGRCVAAVNCVRFTTVTSLGGQRVGLTWRPVATGPETVTIQLANNPRMNGLEALQDVTHEFGHALGLGHDNVGVMHAAISGVYAAPNAAELARVRSLYIG